MKKDDIADIITLTGEIEHARRHLRMIVPQAETDDEERLQLVQARNLREMRRTIMEYLDIDRAHWCLFKSLCIIRQILLEIEWDNMTTTMSNDLQFINDLIEGCLDEATTIEQCNECEEL